MFIENQFEKATIFRTKSDVTAFDPSGKTSQVSLLSNMNPKQASSNWYGHLKTTH